MTGQGDVNNPNAWTDDAPTLGVGSVAAPQPQGDIVLDAPSPTDPDFYFGSFTLQAVVASLGVAAVTMTGGMGQPESPETWAAATPTLGVGSIATPPEQGEIMDPNAWGSAAPSLGVGALPAVPALGDVGDLYAPNELFAGVMETWALGAVTLGVGAVTAVTGQGDVTDPWTWQDSVFLLTSQLYPLVSIEHFSAAAMVLPQPFFSDFEHLTANAAIAGGTLTTSLITYGNWPAEHVQTSVAITGGTIALGLLTYANWPAEHIQTGAAITGGTLAVGLVNYTNWPAEHVQTSAVITGGTLT